MWSREKCRGTAWALGLGSASCSAPRPWAPLGTGRAKEPHPMCLFPASFPSHRGPVFPSKLTGNDRTIGFRFATSAPSQTLSCICKHTGLVHVVRTIWPLAWTEVMSASGDVQEGGLLLCDSLPPLASSQFLLTGC